MLSAWPRIAFSATEALSGPPDGTIGLLRLDAVFGGDACDPTATRPVPLYARPGGSKRIGEIVVSVPMVGSPEGGCTEREVTVRRVGVQDEALPTLEHSYEMKAAVVLERVGSWCRVKFQSGSAWVGQECRTGFMPVEGMLEDRLLYLVDGAGGSARNQPGEGRVTKQDILTREAVATGSVKYLGQRKVEGRVWVELEVGRAPACADEKIRKSAAKVWLPLSDANGRLLVWFYARGC